MDIPTNPRTSPSWAEAASGAWKRCFKCCPASSRSSAVTPAGTTENPTYQEVCSGQTGHAEVIRVKFDPRAISYEKLLETFWQAHDPTTLNRQGPDSGTQYRSIILYLNAPKKRRRKNPRPRPKPGFITRL